MKSNHSNVPPITVVKMTFRIFLAWVSVSVRMGLFSGAHRAQYLRKKVLDHLDDLHTVVRDIVQLVKADLDARCFERGLEGPKPFQPRRAGVVDARQIHRAVL